MSFFIRPDHIPQSYGLYEFEKVFTLDSAAEVSVRLYAAVRYILYVNGEYICEGPCRSTHEIRYFDEVTLPLAAGENRITARVLHMAYHDYDRYFSTTYKTLYPTLIMSCADKESPINTDKSWKVYHLAGHELTYPEGIIGFTPPCEELTDHVSRVPLETMEGPACDLFGNYRRRMWGCADYPRFEPRPIAMIPPGDEVPLTVVKRGKDFIEFDAGRYLTAKVRASLTAPGDVKILYSECYEFDDEPRKRKRDDSTGVLRGIYDIIHGSGKPCVYESFWFRAFRFIRVEAENIDALPLSLTIRDCHYPLDITADFRCSDESFNRMFDVSRNTLFGCLHEIVVDCPYYEQQQYVMDSSIECAVMMRLSTDTRVVKKAIHDFAASQQEMGLLSANYPANYIQLIPGFSFFWVFLMKEYLDYTNDTAYILEQTGTMDRMLNYFEGIVQKNGLIGRSDFWDFVDWVPAWKNGVPTVEPGDAMTIYNLYYACALRDASYLCRRVGRHGLAAEYDERHARLKKKLNDACFDAEKGLYRDGAVTKRYSAHTIIWSILAETVPAELAPKMAERVFDKELDQSSFSMNYFLFRALEKCGRYDIAFDHGFDGWRKMLDLHCTTWCENPDEPRSECHAWSSAPLHELSNNILGVKHGGDGITIAPYVGTLTFAEGHVPTRFGMVYVSWKNENGTFSITVSSPAGVEKILHLPNGSECRFTEADFHTEL